MNDTPLWLSRHHCWLLFSSFQTGNSFRFRFQERRRWKDGTSKRSWSILKEMEGVVGQRTSASAAFGRSQRKTCLFCPSLITVGKRTVFGFCLRWSWTIVVLIFCSQNFSFCPFNVNIHKSHSALRFDISDLSSRKGWSGAVLVGETLCYISAN